MVETREAAVKPSKLESALIDLKLEFTGEDLQWFVDFEEIVDSLRPQEGDSSFNTLFLGFGFGVGDFDLDSLKSALRTFMQSGVKPIEVMKIIAAEDLGT